MDIHKGSLLQLLGGTKQSIIPIYQRPYSWTEKECGRLRSDIVRIAADPDTQAHFLGSVVQVGQGVPLGLQPQRFVIIDGQQRLATVTLLLAALADSAGTNPYDGVNPDEIRHLYLINPYAGPEFRHRLLLRERDGETLRRIVDGEDPREEDAPRLRQNYNFFRSQIVNLAAPLPILNGVGELQIVEIGLDPSQDNPQLIFESLNSTGRDLTEADKIRNYVLMRPTLEDMDRIYVKYWRPIEERFERVEYSPLFDRFMRDYLTIRTGRIPNIQEVYDAFKAFVESGKAGEIQELAADLNRVSARFAHMALLKEPDSDLHQAFEDLSTLKVDVAYPFLLELYEHYASGHLSKVDFLAIVRLVESYVFRRAICGIPTNSLNKTFATLARDLDVHDLLVSTRAALQLLDSYRRFPDDVEFEREFIAKDVYNFRSRNYLLRKLEAAQDPKKHIIVEGYTIEHILPQNPNLPQEWRKALGELWQDIQRQYLHTIGNLTLTQYNPEMSDHSFLWKRDHEKGGFKVTGLALNYDLTVLDHWDADTIQQRAQRLAAVALKAWPGPNLSPEVVQKYSQRGSVPPGKEPPTTGVPELMSQQRELFEELRTQVLNLDSAVAESVGDRCVTFATDADFLDVVPSADRHLLLHLHIPFADLYDPTEIAKEALASGTFPVGDALIQLKSRKDLDDVMYLVLQAHDEQREDPGA